MNSSSDLKKIIKLSALFHIFLIGVGVLLVWVFKTAPKPPEPVWVELVNLNEPIPSKPTPVKEIVEEVVEEVVEETVEPETPPEVEPEVKPEVKPLPPEPKPVVKPEPPKPKVEPKPEKKPDPKPVSKPTPKAEPKDSAKTVQKSSDWDMPDFENVQSQQVLARITDNYRSRVVMAMSRFWNPPIGLGVAKNAVAKYEIVILADGSIQSSKLISSSGSDVLDQRAEMAIKSVTLPPLPSQMGSSWTLIYGFRYENR